VRSTAPGISNNFIAVVVGGIVAVVAGAGAALHDERRHRDGGIERPTWVGLAVAAALLAGAIAWYNLWHGSFLEGAHFTAAITMFVFVGWAAGTNGSCIPRTARWARPWTWLGRKPGAWARAYRCIPVGMVATGILTVVVTAGTRHTVFWLEVVEIVWFVTFWVLQTVEQWDEGIRTEAASSTSAA